MNIEDPITATQAAEMLHFDRCYVGFLFRTGKIAAHKVGNQWMASRAAVKAYNPPKPGPKTKRNDFV